MQRIMFTIETPYGPYTDCITYPDRHSHFWTEEEIEAEKQRRLAAWLIMANPVVEPSAPV
jgi:hypothetical protein